MAGLTIKSDARVNSLFWIKSLEQSEEGSTRRVLDDLEPFLSSIGVPFAVIEPKNSADLVKTLIDIKRLAEDGARPMIHFDTHGNKEDGLYLVPSDEFVGWDTVANGLRDINIATGNNLCVISAACFGFYVTKHNSITNPVMFYLLIGPPDTVSFGFVEKALYNFYKDVFTYSDLLKPYYDHLSPKMELFHSEKLLVVAMARYFRFNCMGKGAQARLEHLVTEFVKQGARNDPATLNYIRTEAKKMIAPSEATFRKYALPYLVGKEPGVTFDEVMAFIGAGQD